MSGILVTGGTGTVGRFIVEGLLTAGHDVMVAGRHAPALGLFTRDVGFRVAALSPDGPPAGLFDGAEALVHAAFDHVPGRYRGGEGDDPEGFRARNLIGTQRLFEAARDAGLSRAVFLSSRAVYGRQPPGARLFETTVPDPDTLYGEVKLRGEAALSALCGPGFTGASLRVTGVYGLPGPGAAHKWSGLFADYLAGREIAPRAGTEVHGEDVAAAVGRLLEAPASALAGQVYNVSDLVIDRRDILAPLKAARQCPHPLPPAADATALNVMDTSRLEALGWRPGGRAAFEAVISELTA